MTGQANPAAAEIPLRRAYDLRAGVASVGARLLGDRLWPRGFATTDLPLNAWLKDITPSTALPKWFGRDPAKWAGFRQDYLAELQAEPQAVATVLGLSLIPLSRPTRLRRNPYHGFLLQK